MGRTLLLVLVPAFFMLSGLALLAGSRFVRVSTPWVMLGPVGRERGPQAVDSPFQLDDQGVAEAWEQDAGRAQSPVPGSWADLAMAAASPHGKRAVAAEGDADRKILGVFATTCQNVPCNSPERRSCTQGSFCTRKCHIPTTHICCGCEQVDNCNVCAADSSGTEVCLGRKKGDGCDYPQQNMIIAGVGGGVGGCLCLMSSCCSILGFVMWRKTAPPKSGGGGGGGHDRERRGTIGHHHNRQQHEPQQMMHPPPQQAPPMQTAPTCTVCNKAYPTQADLATHMAMRHGMGAAGGATGMMGGAGPMPAGAPDTTCSICLKQYPTPLDLQQHIQLRHANGF